MKISEANAQTVWKLFRELSRIPRPSKQEGKVCEWLEAFAKEHRLESRRDAVGNMVMVLPATPGYENAPGVIVQGHTDMVSEKTTDSNHDFDTDPIELIEEDGWLRANKTTLGADNGVGAMMGLALALKKDLPHARIELLFTVDEETGLTGANSLQPGFVEGKILLNLDSEDEGVFTIGCAGGITTELTLPLDLTSCDPKAKPHRLAVDGLTGGHSGVNIKLQRGNSLKALGRALQQLRGEVSFQLAGISGGKAHNAIPRDAAAIIHISPAELKKAHIIVDRVESELKKEFEKTDKGLTIRLAEAPVETSALVFAGRSAQVVLDLISALPHGVQRMSSEIEGLVDTSVNLARIETDRAGRLLKIVTSQRSSSMTRLREQNERISAIARLGGAVFENSNSYPAWQPNTTSPLLKSCTALYEKLYARKPTVEIIHAGLECAVIGSKFPGLDMISFGPTIKDPHTPQERI
ncbi:MAG: aminoacyl-histidine dipeptidase, partial [bacterium]